LYNILQRLLPPLSKRPSTRFEKMEGSSLMNTVRAVYISSKAIMLTSIAALIKGFAARVSEITLNKISTMADTYTPYIENDYVVHADGSTTTDDQ
jgi:hypothetical protein